MEEQLKEIQMFFESFAFGLAAGFFYDMLRPVRYRYKYLAVPADVLFCVMTGACVYIYSMKCASGRIGVWQLAMISAGYTVYMACLSALILPKITIFLELIVKIYNKIKIFMKKLHFSAKNIFKNMR